MLTDDQLIARLDTLNRLGRRLDAKVILLLMEVEDRRLERRRAYPSLYDLCRRRLGMSEGAANRRITAVRLARRIPSLIGHLQQGTLTLSALMLVRNIITEANAGCLVAKVAGKTQNQIDEIVAALAPQPDVPAALTPLPAPVDGAPGSGAPSASADPRNRLAPLSEGRWLLHLTADKALHDKVERARELMRHRNPSGDLTAVVAAAFDALLAKLEAPRTPRPKPNAPPQRRRAIKAGNVADATRADVFARDGQQCTYCDAHGVRCPSTTRLEIDHIVPRALGGSGEASNLRVRCRPHNMLHAEDTFGRSHIEARIRERRRKRGKPITGTGRADDAGAADEPR